MGTIPKGGEDYVGGAGDDTYVVNSSSDSITENLSEGTDLVKSSVTYILSDNIENLLLIGSSDINGTGNNLDNTLTGNNGNNTLWGKAGNDTVNAWGGDDIVYGGSGDDILCSDSGNDNLYGNDGNDSLAAGLGNDNLVGGSDNDTFLVAMVMIL